MSIQEGFRIASARSLAFGTRPFQAFTGLRRIPDVFTIVNMRKPGVAGLVFLAAAALAQQQQSVEITSEPSHHLVFQNEFVRVFNVTVAPKATTLVHRHRPDYVFVTLGDSDVVSVRPGEQPVSLRLKDGEVRFTPGNFAHAAINESDRPFHNITIEMLKPSTSVKTCSESCAAGDPCPQSADARCTSTEKRISADQWTISMVTIPAHATLESHLSGPALLIAVSDLDLSRQSADATGSFQRPSGGLDWIPGGLKEKISNHASSPARFVSLEFKAAQL
jgi:quercetin dioxygenase-like cupin family protein